MRPELIKKIKENIGREIFRDLDWHPLQEFKKFFRAAGMLKKINPKLIHLFKHVPHSEDEIKKLIDFWQKDTETIIQHVTSPPPPWKLNFSLESLSYTSLLLEKGFELSELKAPPKHLLLDFLALNPRPWDPECLLEALCEILDVEELFELAEMSEEEFDQLKRIFEFYYYMEVDLPVEKLMKMRAWTSQPLTNPTARSAHSYCWTLRTRDYRLPALAEHLSKNFGTQEITLRPSWATVSHVWIRIKIYEDPLIEQVIDTYRQYPRARKKILKAIKKKDKDMLRVIVLTTQLLEEKNEGTRNKNKSQV